MRNQSKGLSISAIIDRSIRLYRDNFGPILLFSLIGVSINILSHVLSEASGAGSISEYFNLLAQNIQHTDNIDELMPVFENFDPKFSMYGIIFSFANLFVITPLVSGGIAFIALGACHRQRETISGWFGLFVPIYPKTILTAAAIVVSGILVFISATIGLLFLFFLSTMIGYIPFVSSLIYLLLFAFILVFLLIVATVYSIVYAVAINDGKFGFSAVARAWKLVRRRIGKSIAVLFLTNLLIWAFVLLLMLFVNILIPNVSSFLSTAVVYIIHGLFMPLSIIAPVFLYLDIIMNTEEYDLSLNKTRYGVTDQNATL